MLLTLSVPWEPLAVNIILKFNPPPPLPGQVQSNPLNGSPDNDQIWLLVQVLAVPILVLT